jgi:ketol-acid reductoisomerase
MAKMDVDVIGQGLGNIDTNVDNAKLIAVNESIRSHPIELVGKTLRHHMTAMKKII